jgi:hypothetical protein
MWREIDKAIIIAGRLCYPDHRRGQPTRLGSRWIA